MPEYKILYADTVVSEDIPKLPTKFKATIKKAIDGRLTTNPIAYAKPLRYSLKGHRRLKVSDHRIVYRIDEEAHTVFISAIQHRKDVYE